MSANLMKIMARGAQDAYLSAPSEVTFFKIIYKRQPENVAEALKRDQEEDELIFADHKKPDFEETPK